MSFISEGKSVAGFQRTNGFINSCCIKTFKKEFKLVHISRNIGVFLLVFYHEKKMCIRDRCDHLPRRRLPVAFSKRRRTGCQGVCGPWMEAVDPVLQCCRTGKSIRNRAGKTGGRGCGNGPQGARKPRISMWIFCRRPRGGQSGRFME